LKKIFKEKYALILFVMSLCLSFLVLLVNWIKLSEQFGSVFWDLFNRYLTQGFPFFCLHVIVILIIIFKSFKEINNEIKDIEKFEKSPDNEERSSNKQKGKTAKLLYEFVAESEKLGKLGFFVPMTDYSDRIDSIADGIVGELHDRVNLLLVVGIAGTMFGVFEFVITSTIAGMNIEKLSELLLTSMGKAFPVGFMGLILMFVFQLLASRKEGVFREKLANATSTAIQKRSESSKQRTEPVKQIMKDLQTSIEPLKNLQATLGETIQPVVEKFGEQLKESLKSIEEQSKNLQGIMSTITDLINGIKGSTDNLEALLKDAPQVIQQTIKLQEKQQEAVNEFQKNLEKAKETMVNMNNASQALQQLPQNISSEMKTVFENLSQGLSDSWEKMSEKCLSDMSNEYSQFAYELKQSAKNIEDTFKNSIESIKSRTADFFGSLDDTKALIDNFKKYIDSSFLPSVNELQNEAISWLEKLKQAQASIQDTLEKARDILEKVRPEASKDLHRLIEQSITELKDEHETIKKLQSLIPSAHNILEQIKETTKTLTKIQTEIRELPLRRIVKGYISKGDRHA